MGKNEALVAPASIDTQRQQTAREYARIRQRLLAASLLLAAAILALWWLTGISDALATWLAARNWPVVLQIGVYVGAFGLLFELLMLPLTAYQSYTLPHRYGMSTQGGRAWLVDVIKGTLIGGLFSLGAAEVVYVPLRAAPSNWWLWAALAYALFTVVLSNLAPVLLMPLFFKFTPLDDRDLVQRLTRLGDKAGTRVQGVYRMNLSSRTTAANAMLTGLGNTRRILLGDTLLDQYSADEIEVVLAHEFGHHVHADIPLIIGFDVALTLLGLYLTSLGLRAGVQALGYASVADLRAFPLLVLVLGLFSLVTLPAGHAFSRWRERLADAYAIQSTGKRQAFISAMTRLANQNLSELQPERWVEVLLYSHPPIAKRIAMAERGS